MKLKKKMEGLVQSVQQHPLLTVDEWSYDPPVDPAVFALFEAEYGFPVLESVKECYSEMNGFVFSFRVKDNSDEGVAKFNAASPDYMVETGPPYVPGKIRFLPFEQTFLEPTWKGILYNTGSRSDEDEFTFAGKAYTYNAVGQLLKPFDLFSEETSAAFLLLPGFELTVMLLLDHYVDWKNSLITSFDDYCQLVVDTGGLTEARERFLSTTDGDEKAMYRYKKSNSSIPYLWRKNKSSR